METLLYVLGLIIGALGTWFLLYFLKTRKLLRSQHKLIINSMVIMASMSKEIADLKKSGKKSEDPVEKKDEPAPCEKDCDKK